MKIKFLRSMLALIVLLAPSCLMAQANSIFPNLSGETLRDALRGEYTPTSYLPYSEARDTLFGEIYVRQDSLSGIFTDHTVYLDPGIDPTQAAFKDGGADAINTEHLWPQSKGAELPPAHMDMHNLYPARLAVNSDRANLPFLDIDDQMTDEWYFEDRSMPNIPSDGIDLYSERSQDAFEPRESVKGDIARAMMYFRVIHEEQITDTQFFALQRETLCDWHLADPVDSIEIMQNEQKAIYQGTENPFILDCSLTRRAFCPELKSCLVANEIPEYIIRAPSIAPNPSNGRTRLLFTTNRKIIYSCQLFSATGKAVWSSSKQSATGPISHILPMEDLAPGLYHLTLNVQRGDSRYRHRMKVIKLR